MKLFLLASCFAILFASCTSERAVTRDSLSSNDSIPGQTLPAMIHMEEMPTKIK
jgi:hypothetical protein